MDVKFIPFERIMLTVARINRYQYNTAVKDIHSVICMEHEQRLPRNSGLIVGVLIVALIVGSGITILFIYPIATTDKTSFYIAVAAIILSPIFLLAAFVINVKKERS